MQYTVPQFIDQEDKIIAFITVRQFLILIVWAILAAIFYALLQFWWFIGAALLSGVAAGVLAFVKVNGRPFHYFLISFVERVKKPNVRVWNKKRTDSELKNYLEKEKEETVEEKTRRRYTTSHLSQLALIVDTGGAYTGETVLERQQGPSRENEQEEGEEPEA